jgi:hypothetical protein
MKWVGDEEKKWLILRTVFYDGCGGLDEEVGRGEKQLT